VLAVQPSSPAKLRTITSGTTTLGDTETYMHFHCSSSTTIPTFTGAHVPNWDLALPYPGSLKWSSTEQWHMENTKLHNILMPTSYQTPWHKHLKSTCCKHLMTSQNNTTKCQWKSKLFPKFCLPWDTYRRHCVVHWLSCNRWIIHVSIWHWFTWNSSPRHSQIFILEANMLILSLQASGY
jgi:hypothetical protein